QAHQQQRPGDADDQVRTRRVPDRPQHHLQAAEHGQRLRHQHPRRPGRDRIPHLHLRDVCHRGDVVRVDQLQRDDRVAGEPGLGRRGHAAGRDAALSALMAPRQKPPRARSALLIAALALVTPSGAAAPQPLIKYFQPMPIVGKLSTTVWGASTVGPRDPANGLEDNGRRGGVGPRPQTSVYWDGKVLEGEDGKYPLYASRWAYSNGF